MKTLLENIGEYLGADTNTVVATFTALLVLILGYILSGIIRFIAFLIKQCELRKTFRLIIRQIAKASEKQAIEFIEFSKILTTENVNKFELKQLPNPHLSTWDRLDFSDYYKAFMISPKSFCYRKLMRKAFNSIYEHINVIVNTESKYFNNVIEVSDKYNKYQDNWNASVESIKKEYYLYLQQAINVPEIRLFADSFKEIMKEWQKYMKPRNLKVIDEIIFPKITELCRDNLQINGTMQIINNIDDAKFALANIDTLFDDYKSTFQAFAVNYRAAGKKIVKFSKII